MDAQKHAEKALADTLKRYAGQRVTEGAIVIADVSGQIVAMVGGKDFKRSQYNNVTQGKRQPGSSFKPFVYSAAIEMGLLRPTSMVSNEPFVWRDPNGSQVWKPRGGGGGGMVSVSTALIRSINVPAVHTAKLVGAGNLAQFSRDVFGIDSKLDPVLPLALGSSAVSPLEMAEAYTVFATGGNRVKLFGIKRVIGPSGGVLKEYSPRIVANALSEATALPIRDILRRCVSSGTGRSASGVPNAGGKTGTNEGYLDAWFCGFTDRLVGVSWVSNATYDPNRKPAWRYGKMSGVMGGDAPTQMWAKAVKPIQELIGEKPNRQPPKSFGEGGAETMSALICLDTGARAVPGSCPRTETIVMQTTQARELKACGQHGPIESEPEDVDPGMPVDPPVNPRDKPPNYNEDWLEIEICIDSDLRATQYCPVKRPERFAKGRGPTGFCKIHAPAHVHTH
jgi:penicillin-binding protein 1A